MRFMTGDGVHGHYRVLFPGTNQMPSGETFVPCLPVQTYFANLRKVDDDCSKNIPDVPFLKSSAHFP